MRSFVTLCKHNVCKTAFQPIEKPSNLVSITRLLALAGIALLATGSTENAQANGEIARISGAGAKVINTSVSEINVVAHKSVVVETERPFSKALIADDKIADIVPLTENLLYVVGKKIGSTNLALLDTEKNMLATVEINVTPDMNDLIAKLRKNLPYNRIQVSHANGMLLLSGTVGDGRAADKAMKIANQYAPNAVTNALEVRSTQQVMLEVRFIEASRNASRELGLGTRVRSSRFNSDTGQQAGIVGEALAATILPSGAAPFGSMIARLLSGGTNVDLIVSALEERGLARRLAEPNLVTLSGVAASFLAGGEFPFPVASDDNKIVIEFKKFGVGLKFTPTVLSDGLINLQIEPEVSELDDTAGVVIADVRIPGLVVRRAQTAIELHNGQSFAIAGLLQHANTRLSLQLPWIGDVPVLGALFRSAEYKKQETDLVIIVTPRLVQAARPGERLVTPHDLTRGSTEKEFFLKGKDEWARALPPVRLPSRAPTPDHYGHIIKLTRSER